MANILKGLFEGMTIAEKQAKIFEEGNRLGVLNVPMTATEQYQQALNKLQNAHRSGLADALQYGLGASAFPAPKRKLAKNYGTDIMSMLSEEKAYQLMAMRLRVPEGNRFPTDHLSLHVTDKKAFVFLVNKGQATTLEDDPDLFPSDQLITQIRLLIG